MIRRAAPLDAPGIAAVQTRSWRTAYRGLIPDAFLDGLSASPAEAFWREELLRGQSETFVAEEFNGVIGWISSGESRDADALAGDAEVFAIYVDPQCWAAGTGRLLWNAARASLRSGGYQRVTLWVLEENRRARRFYASVGFEEDAGARKIENIGGKDLVEVRYRTALR